MSAPRSSFGFAPEYSSAGITGLSDYQNNATGLEDGQVLTYVESANKWRAAGAKSSTGDSAKEVPPTVNDGSNEGYQVGSIWVDKVAKKAYMNLDDTPGAAIWYRLDVSPLTVPLSTIPVLSSDIASKDYVDQQISGVKWKDPVKAVSTANLALNGAEVPANTDGVTLVNGDRVLVRAQTLPVQNGVYIYSDSAVWQRAADLPLGTAASGFAYNVLSGTLYADKAFTCVTDEPNDIVGTNNIDFELFTEVIQAGTALEKVNDVMNVKVDGTSVAVNGSNQLYAVAGTYRASTFLTAGSDTVAVTSLTSGNIPKFFKVTATGGGGGGGGGETGIFVQNDCGAGGGAGGTGFGYFEFDPAVPTLSYSVGSGGSGNGQGNNGSGGNSSTFTYNGKTVAGNGGVGGNRGDAGGGNTSGGSWTGDFGTWGGNGGAARNNDNLGAHGGGSWWGSGAGSNGNNDAGGQSSEVWGSGGSGASGNAGGGSGRNGVILIEWAW